MEGFMVSWALSTALQALMIGFKNPAKKEQMKDTLARVASQIIYLYAGDPGFRAKMSELGTPVQ